MELLKKLHLPMAATGLLGPDLVSPTISRFSTSSDKPYILPFDSICHLIVTNGKMIRPHSPI